MLAAGAGATATRVDAAGRTVRVGLYENKPKIFTDETGRASGIFIDLLAAMGAEEGWTLVYVPCTFDDCLASLKAGRIDLMPDVAYSSGRAQELDFHETPVLQSWSQVYAKPGLTVDGFSDLAGKRVAVLRASIQQTDFEQYMRGFGLEVTIVPTDSLEEAFQLTVSGSADAAIANHYFGDYYYQQYGLSKTPIVFDPSELFYATAKGRNPDLLVAIDSHLEAWLQESGSPYYTTLGRWTAGTPAPASGIPQYVYWLIAGIGGLLVVAVGGVLLLRGQVRARTRRLQQTNQALVESERKYRELVELANIIILRWTKDGQITFLNEFGLRFFGYSAGEIVGRDVIGTIVPATSTDGSDLTQLMDRVAADPDAFGQNVNENVRHDGERVWIAWTNRLVRDAQGQVTEILSVGTDITEAKQAEEAIRDLNVSLERRVAERTADLAVARDRAEAADVLKSAFLATMSHELRTPLNSIIGFTGIVLQELPGPLNEEQRKQLEIVRDSARHLLALINDVLDISKIEAGQLDVSSEPFDLKASLLKVVGIVKPLAEKKGLALRVALAPEIGSLVSDPRRVEQVLLNLLGNAVKFTERGEVTLTAEVSQDGAEPPHQTMCISIADTGIGIKPEDTDKLFQPFRQIDTGLSRQHEGTGLGLAICRRLAELLGGDIHVVSEWGVGSTFTLALPMNGPDES